jgi:ABC-type sugar transport system permease subunit
MVKAPKHAERTPADLIQPRDTLRQRMLRARYAYLLLLPMFLSLVVFVYYPPLSALYHSFFDWNPARGANPSIFIGLNNFTEFFQAPNTALELKNMVILLIFGLVVSTTVPLLIAELLFAVKNDRAQYAYRILILIPVIVPAVVTTLLWKFFYDPDLGLFNTMLSAVGLGGLRSQWIGGFDTAIPSLMFYGFPWIWGTNVLIYLAGLVNISGEVIEAASLDGCTGIRRIWHIDLALVSGQIKLFVVLGIIYGVQAFQLQLVFNPANPGGPGYQTYVPGLEMYEQAFFDQRFGYAAAIGALLFLIVLGLTMINFRLMRTDNYDAR